MTPWIPQNPMFWRILPSEFHTQSHSMTQGLTGLPLAGGELGTSYFLPRIVGRGRAAAHLLTGKEISTEQAEQWGLLNEAWSNGDLGVSEHGVYHQLATLRGKMLMNQWDWRVLQDVGKSRQKYRGGTCLIGWIAILMLNLLPFKWGNAIPS